MTDQSERPGGDVDRAMAAQALNHTVEEIDLGRPLAVPLSGNAGERRLKLSDVIEILESAANDARQKNVSGFDALTGIAILLKRKAPSSIFAAPPQPAPDAVREAFVDARPDEKTIKWLRSLAEKGGKGAVNNIDARSLGRIADELERLRDTLEPFAVIANNYDKSDGKPNADYHPIQVRLGDCRKARAALSLAPVPSGEPK